MAIALIRNILELTSRSLERFPYHHESVIVGPILSWLSTNGDIG